MGIVIFTPENMQLSIRVGKCGLNVNRQGQCSLTSTFVRTLGLQEGDKATLSQDDENPAE